MCVLLFCLHCAWNEWVMHLNNLTVVLSFGRIIHSFLGGVHSHRDLVHSNFCQNKIHDKCLFLPCVENYLDIYLKKYLTIQLTEYIGLFYW